MIPCRAGQMLPTNRFLLLVVILSAHKLSLFAPECSVLHKTLGIIQANELFPAFVPEHPRCQPYRIRVRQRIVLMRSTGTNSLWSFLCLCWVYLYSIHRVPLSSDNMWKWSLRLQQIKAMDSTREESVFSSLVDVTQTSWVLGVPYLSLDFNHTGFTSSREKAQTSHLESIAVIPQDQRRQHGATWSTCSSSLESHIPRTIALIQLEI